MSYRRNEFEKLTESEKNELFLKIKELYIDKHINSIAEIAYIVKCTRRTVSELININGITKSKEEILKEKSDKFHSTCLSKYGVDCHLKSEVIKDKIRTTCLERYGCENPLSNKDVQDKVKQTCIERYGFDNSMKSSVVREKSRKTCMSHYGVDYYVKSDESKLNIKQSLLSKYGANSVSQLGKSKEILNILNDKSKFIDFIKSIPSDELYKSKICELLNISASQLNWRLRNWDLNNLFKFKKNRSHYEVEIGEFLNSLNVNFIINYRKLIVSPDSGIPLELDFYLPDNKLAIEFNGLFWHDKIGQERENLKTLLCKEKGIKLIHIWEDDYNSDKDKILKHIKYLIENYVPIESITIERLDKKIPVYDIEVPKYNNFVLANNLVVHNSADTRQQLEQAGFNARIISMDRTPCDGYMYLKASLGEHRIAMLNIPELESEIINLERNNMTGKVDHPQTIGNGIPGRKDMSDSLAGALFNASQFEDKDNLMHIQDDQMSVVEVNDKITNTDLRKSAIDNFTKSLGGNPDPEKAIEEIFYETISSSRLTPNQEELINKEKVDKLRSKLTRSESAGVSDDDLLDAYYGRDSDILIF